MLRLCSRVNRSAGFVVTTLIAVTCIGVASAGAGEPATPASASPVPEPGTYTLDPPHTFVYFAAQHKIVGKVRGRFNKMTGTVVIAKGPGACSLDVSIETGSVDTQNGVRDADLRGPDFFDAAKFPTITYRGRGIKKSADGGVIDGLLTIRGVTKVVPLEFRFNGIAALKPGQPTRLGFHATAAVKRADFKMTRELLDEIGKQPAGPDVWIDIDTEVLASVPPKILERR